MYTSGLTDYTIDNYGNYANGNKAFAHDYSLCQKKHTFNSEFVVAPLAQGIMFR